ncbi:MAG TPA: histidinol dehydrogenase [Thermoleophilaceae bacterium]|nr:histidinol dehydrogenase [Thermoleophilaceae bacterium]
MRVLSRPPSAGAGVDPEVEAAVRMTIAKVREEGDRALLELTARYDGAELRPEELRVDPAQVEAALATVEPETLTGLRTAIHNVREVVEAQLHDPVEVQLDEGQTVAIDEVPVGRVGIYAPAGTTGYPSSLIMCAVTARAAGVGEIAVCAAPAPDASARPLILAVCELCGVREVYRIGGAQAVAALAYGTETVRRVDVIAGPGAVHAQEAKRQLTGVVGIDGIAGPSELVVLATAGADQELVALDLVAQGEHGADSLLVLVSPDPALLRDVGERVEALARDRPSVADADLHLVEAADAGDALRIAEEIAPEHLELVGDEAEGLADAVRRAGCLFIGRDAATAFGDYVAGSNHVLPTGGAARFQSALSAATFRRRMARVSIPPGAAARLAPAGAALARAEGFPVHAESMERRA